METIKSYLETMFANMPNTPEVIRANLPIHLELTASHMKLPTTEEFFHLMK